MTEKKQRSKKDKRSEIKEILKSNHDKKIHLNSPNSATFDNNDSLDVSKVDSKKQNEISDESKKIKDVHSLIIYIDNQWRITKSDWILWVINHMFRPLDLDKIKDSYLKIIEISDEKEPMWVDLDDIEMRKGLKTTNKQSNLLSCDNSEEYENEESSTSKKEDYIYRILPHTKIYTFYQRYSLVFLLDISSSLATIDPFRKNVLVDETIGTFRKCLFGCLEPFCIPQTCNNTNFKVEPEIYLSVLADFSHLFSSYNAEESSPYEGCIKNLLQNVLVTKDNLESIFDKVEKWFFCLQNKMCNSNISEIQRRSSLTPQSSDPLLGPEQKQNSFLEYGLLTLKLLPQDAAPVLVLISDGVPEFKPMDYGYGLRGVAKEGVHLVTIQIGSPFGFTPASSFGYVPDNESFRFLAMATGGKFIYSLDCPNEITNQVKKDMHPNFYHRLILIQEATFHINRQVNRFTSVNFGKERASDLAREKLLSSGASIYYDGTSSINLQFPWNIKVSPPVTESLLTRYRDYALPLEASCILNARLREGFFIEKIGIAVNKQTKADKILINLAMVWLPNVVIQYRIRAHLPSDLRANNHNSHNNHNNGKKYIRIEMNILAPTLFAVSFVNFESSKELKGDSGALNLSLTQLYKFLKSIFATDDTLKSLSSLAQRFPLLKAPKESLLDNPVIKRYLVEKVDVETVKELWSNFVKDKLEFISNGLFDNYSSILSVALKKSTSDERKDKNLTVGYKVELEKLYPLFIKHLKYTRINDNTYIKYLSAHKTGQHSFPSICILKLVPIADTLIWSRLVFINVKYPIRVLLAKEHVLLEFGFKVNNEEYFIKNCQRPLHNILVKSYLPKNEVFNNRLSQLPSFSKGFLKYFTKDWLINLNLDDYFILNSQPSIYDLIYNLLIKAKLSQGFIKITSDNDNSVLFYKELISKWNIKERVFSIQYKITKHNNIQQVTSDIWCEPINEENLEDVSQNVSMEILTKDEAIIYNLISFDLIHQACRTNLSIFYEPLRLRSLVLNSVALISTYNLPKFNYDLNYSELIQKDIDFLLDRAYFKPNTSKDNNNLLEFNLNEEEFFNINSLTKQCLFFLYFIENSILNIMDTAVSGEKYDPSDIPVNKLDGLGIIVPEKASNKWGFAKLINSKSFALTFIPNIIDLLISFKLYINKAGNQQDPLKLKLWTFECIRENLKDNYQLSLNLYNLNSLNLTNTNNNTYNNLYPIIPSDEKLTSVIPELDRMEFWTELSKPQPNISNHVHIMQNKMDLILGRSFIQSLYTSMLQEYKVDYKDVNKVFNLCYKLEFNIDLTNYLNLKTEKNRRGLDQESKDMIEQKFQKSFDRLISNFFNHLIVEDNNQPLIYYFKSPFIFNNNDSNEFNDKGSISSISSEITESPFNISNFLDQVSFPLFMKLSFCLNNPSKYENSYEIESNKIPKDYCVNNLDYSPNKIGNQDSPLESNDNTSSSIKISLFIPHPLDNELNEVLKGLTNNKQFLKHKEIETIIPKNQIKSIIEMKSRLEWLIKEEIIHGLITWRPINDTVLNWIVNNLSIRNPFMDFPSSFNISLNFVNKVKGYGLFCKELENMFISPFYVVRQGDYFYIQATKSSSTMKQEINSPFIGPEDGDLELDIFDGLGISISEPSENESIIPNFWMLLVPNQDYVQILFFSRHLSGVERSRIVQRIRRKVALLLRRVNQLILLIDLNELRLCNKLLLPPDLNDNISEDEEDNNNESINDNNIIGDNINLNYTNNCNNELNLPLIPYKFKIGQFQCPLLFKEKFPLHWRLKPMQALNHILATVMHPLSVQNRHNLYVINDQNSIYYLKLHEVESIEEGIDNNELQIEENEPNSIMTESSINSFPNSPSLKKTNSSSLLNHLRTPNNPTPLINSNNFESREMVLEVYGITIPGKEITQELPGLIYNRLTNHLTLNMISSFLARNVTLKLSQADINFLFPLKKYPSPLSRLEIKLPTFVLNPMLALIYIKQNVSSYLHNLSGIEAKDQYKKFCNEYYKHMFNNSSNSCECFVGEFTMFYNSIASRSPTAIESSIGQGITLVCFTISSIMDDKLLFVPGEKNLQHLGFRPLLTGEQFNIQNIIDGNNDVNYKYKLNIDMWNIGNIDVQAFEQHMLNSVKQSLCDYVLDCCTKSFLLELPNNNNSGNNNKMLRVHSESDKMKLEINNLAVEDNILLLSKVNFNSRLFNPTFNIIDYGNKINNPSMFKYIINVPFTKSSQKVILTQLNDWLADYHINLTPNLLQVNNNGNVKFVNDFKSNWEYKFNTKEDNIFMLLSGLYDFTNKSIKCSINFNQFNDIKINSSRRSSSEDVISIKSANTKNLLKKERSIEELLMHASTTYHHHCQKYNNNRMESNRSYYLTIAINGNSLKVHSYNLSKNFINHLKGYIDKIVNWYKSRSNLLDFILLQKLGLFHQKYQVNQPTSSSPSVDLEYSNKNNNIKINNNNEIMGNKQQNNIDLHKLGLLIKYPTPAKIRNNVGLEVRIKSMDSKSKSSIDNSSIKSKEEEANKSTDIQIFYPNIHRTLINAPNEINYNKINHLDYLQMHGQEFIEQYYRQLSTPKSNFNKFNSLIEQLKLLYKNQLQLKDADEMQIILNRCHLVHFNCTPLFQFKTTQSRSLKVDMFFKQQDIDSKEFKKWYQNIMQSILEEYGKYLIKYIGLHYLGKEIDSDNNINYPNCYYQIWFNRQYPIFLNLCIQDMMFIINIFSVPPNLNKVDHANLLDNLSWLKAKLHTVSFVYDYHIKLFHLWLEGELECVPKINIISLIHTFITSSLFKGMYSFNSIESKELKLDKFNIKGIYQYIVKTPLRYEVKNVYHLNKPIGFYLVDNSLDYTNRKIIITLKEETNQPVKLLYYDIIVYKKGYDPKLSFSKYEEHIVDSEKLINDKLLSIEKQFKKDKIWRNLQFEDNVFNIEHVNILKDQFFSLSLMSLEPTFKQLLEYQLNWYALLNKLIDMNPGTTKITKFNDSMHAIFFNSWNSHFLIYVKLFNDQLDILAFSRDPRQHLLQVEFEHIAKFINQILYCIWKGLHKS